MNHTITTHQHPEVRTEASLPTRVFRLTSKRLINTSIVGILALACTAFDAGAVGPEPPGSDAIGQTLGAALPGYWAVQRLELTEPVDYGNAVDPDWRWRFEAAITPKEALYTEADKYGDVVWLNLTLEPEHSLETLYGTARATFHAGQWKTELTLENRPFDNRGLPRSFFAGRTGVVGSEEAQALRDNAHRRFVEKLEDQHAQQRAATEQRHKTELAEAEAAHRQSLAMLEQQNEAALAVLKTKLAADAQQRREEFAATEQRHKTELAEAEAAHRQSLAMLEQQNEAALAALKTKLAADAQQRREEFAAAEPRHKTELAEAEAAHLQNLAMLEQEHEAALAALKMKLTADAEQQREEFAAASEQRSIDQEGMRKATASAEQLVVLAAQTETAMAALNAQLETLATEEAETLAATMRVVEGREQAMAVLAGELEGAQNIERYRITLDAIPEPDAPWMLEAALRHGLAASDAAMRRHAWLRLLQSALLDTPNGQILLAEHIHTLKDEPILLTFLVSKVGPKLAENPSVLRMLTASLPSIDQWAAQVESYSSQDNHSNASGALGAADGQVCESSYDDEYKKKGWRSYGGNDKTPSIRVAFKTPVLLPTVTVYETMSTGFVRKLTLWGPDGEATEYEVKDPMIGCSGAAKFHLYQHPAPVLAVTVATAARKYNEMIDAISLTGIPVVTPK